MAFLPKRPPDRCNSSFRDGIFAYAYLPGTQMTLVLLGKGLVLRG